MRDRGSRMSLRSIRATLHLRLPGRHAVARELDRYSGSRYQSGSRLENLFAISQHNENL